MRQEEMSDDVSSSPVFTAVPPPYGHPPQKNSPRNFWLSKEHQENGPDLRHSSSVIRRSSLERLKRASRVQNNKLLHQAQSSPTPNGARPMSLQADHATFNTHRSRRDSEATRPSPMKRNSIPSPQPPPKISSIMRGEGSQSARTSPIKSSILSPYRINNGSSNALDSEDFLSSPGRRKGVTFDDAPPCILQYDLITPDPSVSGSSSISYDSEEDEDDEDIENVPVIEPDHWSEQPEKPQPQFMTDRYTSTPSPTGGRPLPPLPGALNRSDSASPRPLPSAPKSPLEHQVEETDEERSEYSDGDMTPTKETSRTFEDELESLQSSLQDGGDEREEREEANNKVEDLSDSSFNLPTNDKQTNEEEDKEYNAPRISRESIMRQVEARRSRVPSSTYSFSMHDDEGVPRSSLDYRDDDNYSVSEGDGVYDVSFNSSDRASLAPSITASVKSSEGGKESRRTSEIKDTIKETESEKKETQGIQLTEATTLSPQLGPEIERTQQITPPAEEQLQRVEHRVSLPEIQDNVKTEGLGLREFMTPSPQPPRTAEPETDTETEASVVSEMSETEDESEDPMRAAAMKFLEDNRPCTPENQRIPPPTDEEMRTPESVIHHAVDDYSDYTTDDYDETDQEIEVEDDSDRSVSGEEDEEEEEERAPTPTPTAPVPAIEVAEVEELKTHSPSPIPEEIATVKASGSRLKTRPSVTPSDMASMAAARRKVSGTYQAQPSADTSVPPVPADFQTGEKENGSDSGSESDSDVSTERGESAPTSPTFDRKLSLSKTSALPPLSELGLDLGLEDLSQEFEKVIEAQKRGYLMRQNTKVVHATSDDAASPREAFGHSRTQSWGSIEPWKNDRRKSGRKSGSKRDFAMKGGVPPLPGQESAVLASVEEQANGNQTDSETQNGTTSEEEPSSGERGRLFVKVLGVKELNLPLPQGQPTYFCLTLDNGLHCVTTSWLELGKNAPIGQEFELVVMNDLEFQLTLQTKLEPPPVKPSTPAHMKPRAPVKPKSTFNKLFQSPKKRREAERLAEEQRRKEQEQQQRAAIPPPTTAWDLLNEIVGDDGSFARSYVCLKDFEAKAYGRALTTEINCFNEWAVDTNAVRKRQGVPPTKRAPYKIGKLEVQLLYVPRPKHATDADMPKSMNSAIREIKEAEQTMAKEHEGFLSQQGGDCPFWRRRYFKLNGSKLTAYHEATRRPRATIDLQKAAKLIDDRSSLTQKSVAGPGSTRRKSGFSEEEEGYMFVEEGFRIRFANGEVIDFYADSPAEKKAWMAVLGDTIGKVPSKKGWCDLIFAHEKQLEEKEEEAKKERERIAAAKAASQLSRAPAVASPRHPYGGPNPNRMSQPPPPPPKAPQQQRQRPMSQVPPSPNRYNGPPMGNRLAASPRLPPPQQALR
ncbi:DUF1709-domain-containing protein [Ascobolus immersus RN42]|uniref:DUF1709-domain-containing protein n=1 Tax=Ascobolus immersus RN42 TaxID=1160509 RepID=A0A3N4INJ6_ASCIM|nr:DUF1709-domain-containing protein [Ascobolus immersus RN42]